MKFNLIDIIVAAILAATAVASPVPTTSGEKRDAKVRKSLLLNSSSLMLRLSLIKIFLHQAGIGPVDAGAIFREWNLEKRDPASVNDDLALIAARAARAGRSGYNSADDPPEADSPVATLANSIVQRKPPPEEGCGLDHKGNC